MRIRNRLLRWTTLAILLSGCADDAPSSTPMLPAPVTHADGALPNWMRSTEWAQRPWTKTPVGAVWRVRHAGQDAWLIDAPSRMARDTLVRSDGAVICNPPGFGAPGDGRCPTVVDAGTMPHLAWSHPGNPSPTFGPPLPMPESEATVALREPRASRPPLPAWLETRVATWERQDQSDADGISVSRLQHKGAATYLVYAGCCDRYNTLYDAAGRELCSPSGGIDGEGDGMCPVPVDPGTKAVTVWEHPGASQR